jgi:hypothetical protein
VPSDPNPRRQRLGQLLIRKRLDLDPRYRNRQVFADERGVEYRIVSDIETARRENFQAVTIAELEHAYALAPGAIGRFIDRGGELEPAPAVADLAAAAASRRREQDADPELAPFLQSVREDLAKAMARYGPGFTGAQAFAKAAEAAVWDDVDREMPAEASRARLIARFRQLQSEWAEEQSRVVLTRG